MSGMKIKKILMFLTAAILIVPMAACSGAGSTEKTTAAEYLTKEDITINQTYENDSDGERQNTRISVSPRPVQQRATKRIFTVRTRLLSQLKKGPCPSGIL